MPPKRTVNPLPSDFGYIPIRIGRLGGAEYTALIPNNRMMPNWDDVVTDIQVTASRATRARSDSAVQEVVNDLFIRHYGENYRLIFNNEELQRQEIEDELERRDADLQEHNNNINNMMMNNNNSDDDDDETVLADDEMDDEIPQTRWFDVANLPDKRIWQNKYGKDVAKIELVVDKNGRPLPFNEQPSGIIRVAYNKYIDVDAEPEVIDVDEEEEDMDEEENEHVVSPETQPDVRTYVRVPQGYQAPAPRQPQRRQREDDEPVVLPGLHWVPWDEVPQSLQEQVLRMVTPAERERIAGVGLIKLSNGNYLPGQKIQINQVAFLRD